MAVAAITLWLASASGSRITASNVSNAVGVNRMI